MINRGIYADARLYDLAVKAWSSLYLAMEYEAKKDTYKAAMHLALACNRELESLGFKSMGPVMYQRVKETWS